MPGMVDGNDCCVVVFEGILSGSKISRSDSMTSFSPFVH